ncbi:G patch domain-containing protein 11 [Physocladia obscura]|uniref:G patch domain-containing protein 11 n=1 Tax=Physocladia obscura TaxID=109957 RepID=A0AAD5T2S5_9FUNG|nr:G patch domain-containing protein 11 [Physocladia obscura]
MKREHPLHSFNPSKKASTTQNIKNNSADAVSADGDDDEDYLSMTFEDPKVTKTNLTYAEKRKREIELGRMRGAIKSTREREIEARDAGLKTNVLTEDNKGFAMLAKLGFKKGMTLGKEVNGTTTKLAEPISVALKSGIGGVGLESAQREKQLNQSKKIESAHHQSEQDFRSISFKKQLDRKISIDLVNARKALQQLDEAAGVPRSECWLPERKHKLLNEEPNIKSDVLEARGEYYKELAADGEEQDELTCEEDSAFEMMEPGEKLLHVNEKLRSEYFYCLWCGDRFNNFDEMISVCPGSTKGDHDE